MLPKYIPSSSPHSLGFTTSYNIDQILLQIPPLNLNDIQKTFLKRPTLPYIWLQVKNAMQNYIKRKVYCTVTRINASLHSKDIYFKPNLQLYSGAPNTASLMRWWQRHSFKPMKTENGNSRKLRAWTSKQHSFAVLCILLQFYQEKFLFLLKKISAVLILVQTLKSVFYIGLLVFLKQCFLIPVLEDPTHASFFKEKKKKTYALGLLTV